MSSKTIYKNANGINAEVTLVNPDTNFNKRTVELNSIMDKTPTIATLRAKTEIPETIYVTGYHSEGDGAFGSNFFRWNATSTEDDNGGTIIKLDGVETGRYELQYGMTINHRWFGSKCDGGTTDDSVAIQSAIDLASTSSISKVINNDYGLTIKSPIYGKNNVTFENKGSIIIDDIPTSFTGAIIVDTISKFRFVEGRVEILNDTYNNNIFHVLNSSDCEVSVEEFIDIGTDRYPLGCIRSQNNTRNKYIGNRILNIKGIGIQTAGDVFTKVKDNIVVSTGNKTPIESNNGSKNMYIENIAVCSSNTATSALGFNDQYSLCVNNIVDGGLHGITAGHIGNPADNSIVLGNIVVNPSNSGVNLQATDGAVVLGNTIQNTGVNGILSDSSSLKCYVGGNIIDGSMTVGIKASNYFTVVGNISRGATINYRNVSEDDYIVATGNIALNGSFGFDWGATANQKNATVVGNFAGDDQDTPTLNTGFRVNNTQNNFFGNSTDGNATFREFSYSGGTGLGVLALPSSTQKDLSSTTKITTPYTDGGTGGAGSAGAGTQYVSVNINGTNYKVLHDGTI